ncbi:MAG: redoxin family protein, partial [Pseudomonadota bacterium]
MSRLMPVGVFLVVVVFLAIGLTRDPSVIPTEMIDRDMPAFELPELREEDVVLTEADLIGETTLVNVFGSWCVACLQEHPTLMQLAEADRVKIVGVNWRDKRLGCARYTHFDHQIALGIKDDTVIRIAMTCQPSQRIL